jgi:Tol biopolymer transport system component
MVLPPGARLGAYDIVALIGAGGMGEVYKARDTRLDRTVAIKVLPADVASDPDRRQRLEREARAVAALNHPHICTLYDIGHQDGTDFLVLEYLEGETLADRLTKGALPLEQALRYAIEVASALDKAHRAGIVHRDLKPGNVFLCSRDPTPARASRGRYADGNVSAKLLDFGLAKTGVPIVTGTGRSMLPTTPPNLTAEGAILGTFQYMAPEQLEGGDADRRADIFAFGAMLYEMVTCRKAFEGKSQASLIAAILEHDPPPLSTLQPLTPPALDRVVKKCLAKDPSERWQSAKDLHDELTWIADAATTPSGVSAMPGYAVARVSRERSAWRLAAAASLVVAVLALAAALIAVRRPTPELPLTRLELVTPPTTDPFSFVLSPDGRQIVFVAAVEGGSKLWLRPLDQTTAQPIAGTEGASAPFWAPDGHAVGFFADAKLKRIDLTGGAPQVLADAPVARGGTWNRDGVILFETAAAPALMQVAATGGIAAALTRLTRGQGFPRWPQFLPDGRRFLFFVGGTPDTRGVYVGSLNGGEPTRVLASETPAEYAPPGYLLLVSQGVLVARPFDAARGVVSGDPRPVAQAVGVDAGSARGAFDVSTAGVLAYRSGAANRRQLVWVDPAGQPRGVLLPPEDTRLAYVELAPDGRQVAVFRTVQGNSDVWLIEIARGLASRFTFGHATSTAPVWSPDGHRVAFRSNRNGQWDLFDKPADGAVDEQPSLVTALAKAPLAWSPDGRFLLYAVQDPKTQSDLWVLPMFGERKPFPFVQTSFDEVQGQFSPDGRWVAYASNEAGHYEVYVRPFPAPGGKWQVSTAGGVTPRWRHDGKELFYVALDNRMMAVPIQIAADGAPSSGAPVALFQTRLTTGNVGIGGFTSRAQYAVSADGRFLLNVSADDAAASPITIVQNWTAGLKP